MTATMDTTDEVAAYAAAVRATFADLPAVERDDLLDDLEEHLTEVATDPAGVGPLVDRIGPAVDYAAELRASAGLPPRSTSVTSGLVGRVAASSTVQRGQDAWARAADRPQVRAARRYLVELRPGWWLLRAYALLTALAWTDEHRFDLVPHLFGSSAVGLVALVVAIPASIWLGRREHTPRSIGWLSRVANVAGIVALLVVVSNLHTQRIAYIDNTNYDGQVQAGVVVGDHAVTNIFPFDAEGKPLTGVLLYDQDGQPITNLSQFDDTGRQFDSTFPTDAQGQPIENSYPLHQTVGEPDGSTRPVNQPGVSLPATSADTAVTASTLPASTTTAAPPTTAPPTTKPPTTAPVKTVPSTPAAVPTTRP